MKIIKHLAVVLSAGILISCAGVSPEIFLKPISANAVYEAEEEQLLNLINEARTQNGLEALQTTPLMQIASDARAEEILSKFSSTRPNGKPGNTIMSEYGINYNVGYCLVVKDCSSIEQMYNHLMSLSTEKKKILDETYCFIGIGITKSENNLYYGAILFSDKAEENLLLMGDVTADKNVNILDVITINRACLGKESLTKVQLYCADINKSGTPDSGDSLEILKYIVGLRSTLAS